MIFRDDDVSYLTNLEDFKKVHEIFNEYNQIHTIALLTKDIDKNLELIDYIKSQKNIDVQIHGYDHIDFVFATDEEIAKQLQISFNIITNRFKCPSVFYPPFNSCDKRVIEIARKCGLETSYEKTSCIYYLKHNGNVIQDTLNFHYHDYIESILIGPCLKLYSERNNK